jgi:hypothetical protein
MSLIMPGSRVRFPSLSTNTLHLLVATNGCRYWGYNYRFCGKQKTLAPGVHPRSPSPWRVSATSTPGNCWRMVLTPAPNSRGRGRLLRRWRGSGHAHWKDNRHQRYADYALRRLSEFRRRFAVAAAVVAPALRAAASKPDIQNGKTTLDTMSGICHSVQETGGPTQGPNLPGVVGRKAGSEPRFTRLPSRPPGSPGARRPSTTSC